jgi:hypothetical protein
MSLFLTGIVLGASLAVLGIVFAAVTIGIRRQERAASLGHRPTSLSAILARRILGLYVRTPAGPHGPAGHHTEDTHPAKETTR